MLLHMTQAQVYIDLEKNIINLSMNIIIIDLMIFHTITVSAVCIYV